MHVGLLLVALLTAVADMANYRCPPPTFVDDWTPSAAAIALVRAPVAHFGESVASIRRIAGQPMTYSEEPVENRHEPGVRDTRARLEYPGITFEVLALRGGTREFLERVELIEQRPDLRLPVALGNSQQSVANQVGRPFRCSSETLQYLGPENGVGRDSVDLAFEDKRLVRIVWTYFID